MMYIWLIFLKCKEFLQLNMKRMTSLKKRDEPVIYKKKKYKWLINTKLIT